MLKIAVVVVLTVGGWFGWRVAGGGTDTVPTLEEELLVAGCFSAWTLGNPEGVTTWACPLGGGDIEYLKVPDAWLERPVPQTPYRARDQG